MPMRILGRGRDAYIFAGYLEKRGKWTPHWSERYFVLTCTHLHYFRKDREQLFGEERGSLPIDRIKVKQRDGKNTIFEISILQRSTVLKDSNTSKYGSGSNSENRPKSKWVLRAKTDPEGIAWMKAIRDAQAKITPEMIVSAAACSLSSSSSASSSSTTPSQLPPPASPLPLPSSSSFSLSNIDSTSSSYTLLSNDTSNTNTLPSNFHQQTINHKLLSNEKETIPPSYVSLPIAMPVKSSTPSHQRSASTNSVLSHDIRAPIVSGSPIMNGLSPTAPTSTGSIHTQPSSSVPKSSSPTSASTSFHQEDPLVLVTVEQPNKLWCHPTSTGTSTCSSTELVVGRNIEWGRMLSLGALLPGSVIVACLHDGTTLRIDSDELLKEKSGTKTFSAKDVYRHTHVRIKWHMDGYSYYDMLSNMSSITSSILFPFLFLSVCSYIGGHSLYSKIIADWPLLDLRQFSAVTEHAVVLLLGIMLSFHVLRRNIDKFQMRSKKRFLKIAFIDRIQPHERGAPRNGGSTHLYGNGFLSPSSPLSHEDDSHDEDGNSRRSIHHRRAPLISDEANAIVGSQTPARSSISMHEYDDDQDQDQDHDHDQDNDHDHDQDDHHDDDIDSDVNDTDLDDHHPQLSLYPQLIMEHMTDDSPAVHEETWGGWTESDFTAISVRGANYLRDSKKIPAGPHVFRVAHLDVCWSSEKIYHMSARPNSFANRRYRATHENDSSVPSEGNPQLSDSDLLNPLLVVNFLVPLGGDKNCNCVLYFTRRIQSKKSRPVLQPQLQPQPVASPTQSMPPLTREVSKAGISTNSNNGDSSSNSKKENSDNDNVTSNGNSTSDSEPGLCMNNLTRSPSINPQRSSSILPLDDHHNASLSHPQSVSSPSPPVLASPSSSPMTVASPVISDSASPSSTGVLSVSSSSSSSSSASSSSSCPLVSLCASSGEEEKHAQSPPDEATSSSASSSSFPPATPKLSSASLSSSPRSFPAPVNLSSSTSENTLDEDRLEAFDRLLTLFLNGDDKFRDKRMKIIPRVADGGWIVKKVVGGKPAILGQKLTQHYNYNREKNYLEIAVDCGSSRVAGKILSVVNGQAAHLVVDVSFVLQGEADDELPEVLLGGVRLIHLKLDKFKNINEIPAM